MREKLIENAMAEGVEHANGVFAGKVDVPLTFYAWPRCPITPRSIRISGI